VFDSILCDGGVPRVFVNIFWMISGEYSFSENSVLCFWKKVQGARTPLLAGATRKLRYNPAALSSPSDLKKFLDSARNQGASDETLASLLRGREWPQEDVHRALADDFENRTGIGIPNYKKSGSAKDAFLYLFCFATLATWTIALGSILFTLIERWFPDPLIQQRFYRGVYYEVADSLACVIIAFPIYLFVTRAILRELRLHPEKLESSVRKWLTYIALLIAAGVVIGDLITFLTYFLRGEMTSTFVAKVATVLLIAGGVFWYYLGSLRRADSAEMSVARTILSGPKS
jgi:Domain of unknown function (DUF5671)